MPYCFASPGSALASTVVREKEAYTSVQNQMQVAMEILCVPRMANDSVPVRGLFIETERHPVHVRQIGQSGASASIAQFASKAGSGRRPTCWSPSTCYGMRERTITSFSLGSRAQGHAQT